MVHLSPLPIGIGGKVVGAHALFQEDKLKLRTTIEDWTAVETENEVAKAMQRAQRWTEQVCKGDLPVAYLCGGAGLGKTRSIKEGLKNSPFEPIFCNPINFEDIIRAFKTAAGKRPIIFEEADHVLNSVRMVNLLKIATDEDGPRVSENSRFGRVKMDAPVLLASNRDMNDGKAFPKEVRDHVGALRSRSEPLIIPSDPVQVWEYACYLAIVKGMLRTNQKGQGVSVATQNRALKWFTENMWRMDDVSPRRLIKIMQVFSRYSLDEESLILSDLQPMLKLPANAVADKPDLRVPQIILNQYAPHDSAQGDRKAHERRLKWLRQVARKIPADSRKRFDAMMDMASRETTNLHEARNAGRKAENIARRCGAA